MGNYSFDERMVMSDGVCERASVDWILMKEIPGCIEVVRASQRDDRSGTDWWAQLPNHKLSIDAKVRSKDYAEPHLSEPKDDLALETWSVIDKKVGWTRDENKRTDYVLWLWTDTGRWCLLPFAMLCAVMQDKWQDWKLKYKVDVQSTYDKNTGKLLWKSECVFVPRREVWAEIYRRFSGSQKPLLIKKNKPTGVQFYGQWFLF